MFQVQQENKMFFLRILHSGRQRKSEHDLTASSVSGHVHRFVWQPKCICLQCNHQEMPGKCFNLPILIQNARALNQAALSKYSSRFLAWPLQWVCTALSLSFFLWSTLALTPHSSIHYRNTPPFHWAKAACVCEICITFYNEIHSSALTSLPKCSWASRWTLWLQYSC